MTLMLLAGTADARAIAAQLADHGLPVLASLAGAVRDVPEYPVPTRTGGFGGEDGFRAEVDAHGITAILDATHPFAARITDRTARLCREMGLPYARMSRPTWEPVPDDDWQTVASPEEAARRIPSGARVFLATGANDIGRYADLDGRAEVFCRRAEDTGAAFPFAKGRWIVGRGPFAYDDDLALLNLLGIDHVITKNSGGAATRAKLDAARDLRLPVIMIARPSDSAGVPILTSVADAVAWARAL